MQAQSNTANEIVKLMLLQNVEVQYSLENIIQEAMATDCPSY